MKRTIAELKANIPADAVYAGKVDNNTIMFKRGNLRGWILHDTIIAEELPGGLLRLDSGYYLTLTTKDRLNKILQQVYPGMGLAIWQAKNKWSIYQWGKWYAPYFDGITLDKEGRY